MLTAQADTMSAHVSVLLPFLHPLTASSLATATSHKGYGKFPLKGLTLFGRLMHRIQHKFLPCLGHTMTTLPFSFLREAGRPTEKHTSISSTVLGKGRKSQLLWYLLYLGHCYPSDLRLTWFFALTEAFQNYIECTGDVMTGEDGGQVRIS